MPWYNAQNISLNAGTQEIVQLTSAQIPSTIQWSGQIGTPVDISVQTTTGAQPNYPDAVIPPPGLNVQAAVLINETISQLTRFPSA